MWWGHQGETWYECRDHRMLPDGWGERVCDLQIPSGILVYQHVVLFVLSGFSTWGGIYFLSSLLTAVLDILHGLYTAWQVSSYSHYSLFLSRTLPTASLSATFWAYLVEKKRKVVSTSMSLRNSDSAVANLMILSHLA